MEYLSLLPWTNFQARDVGGGSALHYACVKNQIAMVSFLLTQGVKSNKDKFGWTPAKLAQTIFPNRCQKIMKLFENSYQTQS